MDGLFRSEFHLPDKHGRDPCSLRVRWISTSEQCISLHRTDCLVAIQVSIMQIIQGLDNDSEMHDMR